MKYCAAVLVLILAASAVCDPTVYMIRHGEKPRDAGTGLSPQGVQRAQCLRSVFGTGSLYHIGHIMAQKYKSSKQLVSGGLPGGKRLSDLGELQTASGSVPMTRWSHWPTILASLWTSHATVTTRNVLPILSAITRAVATSSYGRLSLVAWSTHDSVIFQSS